MCIRDRPPWFRRRPTRLTAIDGLSRYVLRQAKCFGFGPDSGKMLEMQEAGQTLQGIFGAMAKLVAVSSGESTEDPSPYAHLRGCHRHGHGRSARPRYRPRRQVKEENPWSFATIMSPRPQ